MEPRRPCPHEDCEHWNPVDRTDCFRCDRNLSATPAVTRRPATASRKRSPLLVVAGVAVVLAIALFAWFQLRERAALSDDVPPVLFVEEPAAETVHVSSETLRVSGHVDDEHPASVDAGGEMAEVIEGRFELEIPITAGGGEIAVVARDVAGNLSEARRIEVIVDRDEPSIVTLEPPSGTTLSTASAVVSGEASEELAAAAVAGQSASVAGTSFRGELTLQPGENELLVAVTDLAGNTTEQSLTLNFEERRLPAGFDSTGRTPSGHEIFTAAKDQATLILLPEGTFTMGSEGGDADERPTHEVTLPSFFISSTPVTNAQYARFVEDTGRRAPAAPPWDADYAQSSPDAPVINVTWSDARDYAEWAGRRLPTEAEWEYAARGARALKFPWGAEPPPSGESWANLEGDGDGYENTSPVGSFPQGASPFGMLDAVGNVWEWTGDWYSAGYYRSSPEDDPTGPSSGSERVVKGGSFISALEDARPANRWRRPPASRLRYLGFRTAADFPE